MVRKPWIGAQWLFGRTGAAATNHFEAGAFIRSNDRVAYPNLQYHFLPLAIRYDGSGAFGHGYQVHVGPMNSDVRGEVKIKSKDPAEYPRVLFNYLSTEQEKREWIEAIHCTRRIMMQMLSDLIEVKKWHRAQKLKAMKISWMWFGEKESLSSFLYLQDGLHGR